MSRLIDAVVSVGAPQPQTFVTGSVLKSCRNGPCACAAASPHELLLDPRLIRQRRVNRAGIQHNIGSDLFRFMVEFSWTGGSEKRAVLIHSV